MSSSISIPNKDFIQKQQPFINEKTSLLINKVDDENFEEENLSCFQSIPKRYILTFVAFFGFFNVYALRACLSVAIQPMQDEYDWNEHKASTILSSFFWGYIVTQLPGGFFATKIGGKEFLLFAVLITSLLTLITPVTADYLGEYGIIVVRVLEGLGEAVSYPAMHAMLSVWTPIEERTTLPVIVYGGAFVGTIAAFPISGILSDETFLRGWPLCFYVFGALGVLWSIVWQLSVASTPEKHSTITRKELNYIQRSLAEHGDDDDEHGPVPWAKMFTNKPFWALTIVNFSSNWGFYLCLTMAPTYITKCLLFNVKGSAFLSMLPYIGIAITFNACGPIADKMIEKKFSVTFVRKFFTCLSYILSSAAFVSITYVDNPYAAVALMTAAVAMIGINSGGGIVNHIDIAGPRAGIVMGCTNTAGTLAGILPPLISGWVLDDDDSDAKRWQTIFFIAAGVQMFACVVYGVFGSGKRQF